MTALVRRHLASPDACCIADEQTERKDGAGSAIEGNGSPATFFVPRGNYSEVYTYLPGPEADDGAIRDVLRSGGFWQDIILTRRPDGIGSIHHGGLVSEEQLRAPALNTPRHRWGGLPPSR